MDASLFFCVITIYAALVATRVWFRRARAAGSVCFYASRLETGAAFKCHSFPRCAADVEDAEQLFCKKKKMLVPICGIKVGHNALGFISAIQMACGLFYKHAN